MLHAGVFYSRKLQFGSFNCIPFYSGSSWWLKCHTDIFLLSNSKLYNLNSAYKIYSRSVWFEQISTEFSLDSHTIEENRLSFKENAAGWMGLHFDRCKMCAWLRWYGLKYRWKWKHICCVGLNVFQYEQLRLVLDCEEWGTKNRTAKGQLTHTGLWWHEYWAT